MLQYENFSTLTAFTQLKSLGKTVSLKSVLTKNRVSSYSVKIGKELTFNYAACAVDERVLAVLKKLAEESQAVEKFESLAEGEWMNTGENRRVLHHLTRGELKGKVIHEGKNLHDFYAGEQKKFSEFAKNVHDGKITNAKGKLFTTVVQIGIGGSDLGPRAMYLALDEWASANKCKKMNARFISNVDPDDADSVLSSVDLETTLFILVSKSGTTQETLANELIVKAKLASKGLDSSKHMVAVTSETSPLAKNANYLASFYIDDFIGGRYSSTSAVGGVILSLAFGSEVFARFLQGAHEADKNALNKDALKNASLLDALIGVYERNVLGHSATAILPYSQALSRFPAHLQQCDMESNGKTVNRFGKAIDYATGPVIMGESGTNGQHSFYQLLHQGTDIMRLQFAGFKKSQGNFDLEVEGSTSQTKLNANLVAQIVAFAEGKDDANANKCFAGERPSSLIYGEQLNPEALGELLAHYENKIMFQGFIWNLNSFDQEGVQLGKLLTKKVLAKDGLSEGLAAYAALLGV